MKRMKAYRNQRIRLNKANILIILLAVFILLYIGVTVISNNLKPIIGAFALTRAQSIGMRAINEAVNKQLTEQCISYNDLIDFEKDNDGKISALKTNIVKVNNMKSLLVVEVLDSLSNIKSSEISIPVGNLINGELLSGRGPRIPIKLLPMGSVSVELTNVFTTAGINQTRHQILLNITANVSIIMPISAITGQVASSICVAETVIVGEVPDSYTSVESDKDLEQKIVDYANRN